MVGDKVLLRPTAFKGKHKIQDHWEDTIYEVLEQPLGKIPVFKIKSMEGADKVKIVHRNLLLPLLPDPSDQTSEQDSKSLVDPKETISTQVVIAAGTIASHVYNLSACEGAQVTNMFQRDWIMLQLCFGNTEIYWVQQDWIYSYIDMDLESYADVFG